MQIIKLALMVMVTVCIASNAYSTLALKEGNTVVLTLRDHIFRIPEQYSREAAVPIWLKWLPGLDDGAQDALLIIPAEEVKQVIRDYVELDNIVREDLLILISALTEREVANTIDPARRRELWYATGEYEKRVVEPVDGKPWFRVFRDVTFISSWELVRQYPDPSKPLPSNLFDYWIGTCSKSSSPVLSPDNLESCDIYVIVENLLIEFSVSQRNLHLLEQIKTYVIQRIQSWQSK